MYIINSYGLNDCLHSIAHELKRNGKEVCVRGLKTRELPPCFIKISNPKARTLLYPKRGNNPFASLAETMWVLAGRIDMKWLKTFLPRCVDYSDDNYTWRAGYGARIRNWNGLDDS